MARSYRSRVRAILESDAALGWEYLQSYPQIAELWRQLETGEEIVERLKLYGDRNSLSRILGGLKFALHGNPYTYLSTPPYEGLLAKEEAKELAREHKRVHGFSTLEQRIGIYSLTREELQAQGRASHAQRTGVHAMSTEERRAIGKRLYREGRGVHARSKEEQREHGCRMRDAGKGIHGMTLEERTKHGKAGGRAAYEAGTGIHALSATEHSRISKEAARKSREATGKIAWFDEKPLEPGSLFSYACALAQHPRYHAGTRIRAAELAEKLSAETGQEITAKKVKSILYLYKADVERFNKTYNFSLSWRSQVSVAAQQKIHQHMWMTSEGPTRELVELVMLSKNDLRDITQRINTKYGHNHNPGQLYRAINRYVA